jgi:hypothetical protein
MRSVTRAECLVIGSLLGSTLPTVRQQIRQSGLAPRTFEVARRRIFEAGWLSERFLPDPRILGYNVAIFAVARPYAEHADQVVQAWRDAAGCVLIWRMPETLLGVFLGHAGPDPSEPIVELGEPGSFSQLFQLRSNLDEATVPVYFDYEGAWSRVAGIQRSGLYPRSLPFAEEASVVRRETPRRFREIEATVGLPFLPVGLGGAGPQSSSKSMRTVAARVLSRGWVERRTFLNLESIPHVGDWKLDSIVLVHGQFREGGDPLILYRELVERCRVTPFLFASDEAGALIGALSPAPLDRERPAGLGRASASGTIRTHLEEIEVHREPVLRLSPILDHRYSRLFELLRGEEPLA